MSIFFLLIKVIKALHIIAVICWMAALLYLPRLFVYHATKSPSKQADAYATFCTMERRLINIIMHPSMLITLISGVIMILSAKWYMYSLWLHIKVLLVMIMVCIHFYFISVHKSFMKQKNIRSTKFFKIVNEVPSILMIIIVMLVVIKPWD